MFRSRMVKQPASSPIRAWWHADDIVLATGVWSNPLAAKLGIDVPMEAERGYHVEFVNPSVQPKVPVMVGEWQICHDTNGGTPAVRRHC